jgi:hypothetical protein
MDKKGISKSYMKKKRKILPRETSNDCKGHKRGREASAGALGGI